jgi:hypothetical protein
VVGPLLAAQGLAPCGGKEAADMGCCGGKRRSRGGVGPWEGAREVVDWWLTSAGILTREGRGEGRTMVTCLQAEARRTEELQSM